MKLKKKYFTIIFLMLVHAVSSSFAEVTVVSIKGNARYKAGNQWLPLAPGIKLAEGTKISTAVRSEVALKVNGDDLIVRQMTMIKIEQNLLSANQSNSTIGLKRGGLNAKIARDRKVKTSFKVSTPVATSSVRGTWEEISYGPGMGMVIKVIEGEILAENRFGASNLVRGRLEYRQDNHRSAPGHVGGNLRDGARGESSWYLTDDEKKYMDSSSDAFNTPDDTRSNLFENDGPKVRAGIAPNFP